MIAHLNHDQVARMFLALSQAVLGALQMTRPGCFIGTGRYFGDLRASLTPGQSDRLARVLAARSNAEGNTDVATRWSGLFALAMVPVALIPAIPYAFPYAASCLALALATLAAYLRFRRATERRVAPLARRSALSSLPPVALVATAVCLAGVLAFAALPGFRLAAVVICLSAVALCAIAWRVAVAPALLFGDDPQLEYQIDERVRFRRATGLIALACAAATVFVVLADASLRGSTAVPFDAVTYVVVAAFIVSIVVSLNPLRKRMQLA